MKTEIGEIAKKKRLKTSDCIVTPSGECKGSGVFAVSSDVMGGLSAAEGSLLYYYPPSEEFE